MGNMNKRGYILFELVASMGFILIVFVNLTEITINLTKKMTEIYKESNIKNTINLVTDKIGYDFYSRYSCSSAGSFVYVGGKLARVQSGKLIYNSATYGNDNVKFESIKCEEKNSYYKLIISYNSDQTINLYSIKKK